MIKKAVSLLSAIAGTSHAVYVQFPVYDSSDTPNTQLDGLLTYAHLKASTVPDATDNQSSYLLCTTCTISYVLSKASPADVKSTATMTFKDGSSTVKVEFVNTNFLWKDIDGAVHQWNMDLGFIDPALYATEDYFDYFNESVLGLAPFLATEDESLLDRQFLYNFVKSNPLEKFEESFAFIGGGAVLIGGA